MFILTVTTTLCDEKIPDDWSLPHFCWLELSLFGNFCFSVKNLENKIFFHLYSWMPFMCFEISMILALIINYDIVTTTPSFIIIHNGNFVFFYFKMTQLNFFDKFFQSTHNGFSVQLDVTIGPTCSPVNLCCSTFNSSKVILKFYWSF